MTSCRMEAAREVLETPPGPDPSASITAKGGLLTMVEQPQASREYRLSLSLSMLDVPRDPDRLVSDADSLLDALVDHSDPRGRYYANPLLLRRLFWWEDRPVEAVRAWLHDLVARGEVSVSPLARSNYSGRLFEVVVIQRLGRFPRWKARPAIPDDVRLLVYARSGNQCVTCGTGEQLSLDHIYPYSLGGSDDAENLQAMCRPCNSRKGARIDA